MIFLLQFGINKHSQIFQRLQFFVVFEKFARAYLFQIALEIIWLPIQIILVISNRTRAARSFNFESTRMIALHSV